MAYNSEVGAWGGMANPGAKAQTFAEFMAALKARPGLLGANGRMQGSSGGGPWDSQNMTPEDFYKEKMATKVQSGFTGFGDNMEANMVDPSHVSLDRTEDTRSQGLKVGLAMLSAPFAAAAMGFGAGGGAGGASGGFTGMGGAGGAMGAGADFGLVGAGAEAAGTAAGAAGTGGFTGSMLMPELAGSMPAGVTSYSSMIPAAAEVGTGFLTPAGTLGGATAVGGGLIGSGTAAEGAAAMAGSGGLWGKATDFLSNPSNLLKVGGTVLGALGGAAASGDSTTSKSNVNEPWSEAKPYLIDNLKTNAAMAEYYRQNPFSDLQKQQYQGLFNNLANSQANIPAMMANANSFGQSRRGQMPAMQGLLSGTQAAPIDWTQYQNIGRKG